MLAKLVLLASKGQEAKAEKDGMVSPVCTEDGINSAKWYLKRFSAFYITLLTAAIWEITLPKWLAVQVK